MKTTLLVLITVAMVAILATASMAQSTVWFSTGSTVTAIGDQIGYGYDIVNMYGVGASDNLQSVVLNGSTPTTVTINTLDFIQGPNTYSDEVVSFDAVRDLTVNGETKSVVNTMTDTISSNDTLTWTGGNEYLYGNVKVTLLASAVPVYGYGTNVAVPGNVQATFQAVPEPMSVLAACTILGPVGFVFRRKRA
jgi:hypothetical protein